MSLNQRQLTQLGQELDDLADKYADLLGVDPEDILTEPWSITKSVAGRRVKEGRISLTVSQANRLLSRMT